MKEAIDGEATNVVRFTFSDVRFSVFVAFALTYRMFIFIFGNRHAAFNALHERVGSHCFIKNPFGFSR